MIIIEWVRMKEKNQRRDNYIFFYCGNVQKKKKNKKYVFKENYAN